MTSGHAHPSAPARSVWLTALAYLVVFLALDWVSYIRPYEGLNITPWNPQPALAVALLMLRPRWIVLVWASIAIAEVLVRGWPPNMLVTLTATAALALSWAAVARVLGSGLNLSHAPGTRRELAWFAAVTIGGALISGLLYVGTLTAGGQGPHAQFTQAVLRYWVGDAVGLLVTLPVLLIVLNPIRRAELRSAMGSRSIWVAAALVMLLLAFVFSGDDKDHFKFFYLLFLPVVWAAAHLGLAGAVLLSALAQAGLIVAVQAGASADLTVFEFQVLMAALTITALLLGVAVDERRRAEAELRGSLRLAAAGQMAAALAHELSQPLTALNSYAQASRLLASQPDLPPQDRLDRLAEVARRMADDALRAGEVVKRLRDFFRTGSTQLQRTPFEPLLHEAISAARHRADAQSVRLEVDIQPIGDLLIDPIQIAVVLRNLFANALDATAAANGSGRVSLRAWANEGVVRVDVLDNGPGVDPARLAFLFEPGESDKPAGMGIGLSICRAIVEAHGGRLWAEPGGSGIFCLSLPIDHPESTVARHAP